MVTMETSRLVFTITSSSTSLLLNVLVLREKSVQSSQPRAPMHLKVGERNNRYQEINLNPQKTHNRIGLLASFSITGSEGKMARASEETIHFLFVRIRWIITGRDGDIQ